VDKNERPSFDTIELIEAESLVVLNTLTKQYFQDAFKNDRSTESRSIHVKEDYFEGDGSQ
jgi:hypothetical protein